MRPNNSNAQPTKTPAVGLRIMTVQEVATLFQVPVSSIYEKTRQRVPKDATPPLPFRRVGKYIRFIESEVVSWLLTVPQNTQTCRSRKKRTQKQSQRTAA